MDVSDYPNKYRDTNVSHVVEKHFLKYYVHPLGDNARYVRLESTLLKLFSLWANITY